MNHDGSVTTWIRALADGQQSAAQAALFARYFEKLMSVARARAKGARHAIEDEEDVAISAMESFFRRAQDGQFPDLDDRYQLWALLVTITVRKAINQHYRLHAQKRSPSRSQASDDESGFDQECPIDELPGDAPSPELVAQLREEFQLRLDSLNDPTLRRVALLKLEGHDNEEIAKELNVALRTVGRKLNRIRCEWSCNTNE
ncbi:MAG: ECF-type sigma factor [Pirellulaceae bacterium]|nr:hypothetical protein [Planctomycetales bacterium]